ncbi:BamA/TamA family outer membrane protein [Trichocoleus sp. FACHB-90]|uniref:BamA/TamA family outer membrane protein n=1 Tax=Cyanophyceae TaxID=3028117 RepID=UPI001687D2BD|nr:BamA/TamA family outer membrane protein [Trichocoleus sp. FACHB-90]MBD1926204.1 BamA/TamA family outer membrane protein [Trichocoleus sp. FACHB-90]
MRVPSLAIYTFALLAAADLGSNALASTTPSPTQTPEAEATNLVVPVNSATPVATTSTQKLANANPVVPVNTATPELADAKVVVPVNSATPVATTSTQKLADAKVVVPVNTARPVSTTSTSKPADGNRVVVPVNSATTPPVRAIAAPETINTPQFTPTAQTPRTTPTRVNSSDLVVTATDVQVVGVTGELQQVAQNAISTRPGGDTSQSQLQKDVAAILETGLFADANVTTYAEKNGLRAVFQVSPVVVRSVQLSGAQVLTPAVANDIFKSQIGTNISPAAITQGVQQIKQWYEKNGYTLAQVIAVQPGRDGVLAIQVAEGIVGDVKIRFVDKEGNPTQGRTKEDFLLREIKLKSGQPFRVDVARGDLQQLYQLGLFENADVSLNGDPRKVDVTYELTEGKSRSVNVGGGYSDNSGLYGTLSYNDRNLGGTNQQLGGNLQVSPRDVQFDGKFSSPYRASNPDRLGYSVDAFRQRELSATFNEDVKLPNGDQVREGRFGGGVTVTRPVGDFQGSVGLNYTRTSIRDRDGNLSPVDELGNRLSYSGNGIDDKVALSAGVVQDRRDNPVNPSKGSLLSLSTEQSIPVGNGNILMNRLQANYSQYVPVNLIGNKNAEVLAFNVQGGTTIGNLPPYEAFNLGGINSVRGYGSGDVASGRSFVLASAEYRFPIYQPVGGVLFADFGSDLGSGDTVPGEPGTVRDKPGAGFGYGAGLRLSSPIGLIRADFGINNQGDSRLQFGIGQRF